MPSFIRDAKAYGSRLKAGTTINYFRFAEISLTPTQITGILRASRSTKRGGSRSSRNAGRDAVDAGGTVDELCRRVRLSRVVLTPGLLASSP